MSYNLSHDSCTNTHTHTQIYKHKHEHTRIHITRIRIQTHAHTHAQTHIGQFGVDIGPASAARFVQALSECGTVFWNGPMGKFEVPAFAVGTQAIANAVASSTKAGAITVVGGA